MSVDMKIVLVGEEDDKTRAQQQALDQPSTAPAQQEPPTADAAGTPSLTAHEVSNNQVIGTIGKLIDHIDELINSVDSLKDKTAEASKQSAGPGKPPKPPPIEAPKVGGLEGFLGKLDERIQDRIRFYGLENTRAGRLVGFASRAARRAGTSVARAGRGLFGRAAGGTAARAGTAAAGAAARAGTAAAVGGAAPVAAVAAPLVAIGLAAAGAALSLKMFVSAVQSAANSLEDLSPDIASVRAQFGARREMQRLERAQAIGPAVAQVEAARMRVNESMYEVQTKIYQLLLKGAPVVEKMLDGVTVMTTGITALVTSVDYIWSKINDLPVFGANLADNNQALMDFADALNAHGRAIQRFMDGSMGQPAPGKVDPFLNDFFGMNPQAVKPRPPRRPRQQPQAPPGPLFGPNAVPPGMPPIGGGQRRGGGPP